MVCTDKEYDVDQVVHLYIESESCGQFFGEPHIIRSGFREKRGDFSVTLIFKGHN